MNKSLNTFTSRIIVVYFKNINKFLIFVNIKTYKSVSN